MSNRLKELRQKNNLTLKELGSKIGIPNNSLSQYENGRRQAKLEVWQKLADFFDVSVPYLQGFETQIPNRLRELRRSHGLTLKDTVEKVKEQEALIITADALAKYERGDREPKLEILQKLADFFKVPVPYVQGFDKYQPNKLKELRDKKGMSQSQFVQTFNELLISKKMKPITIPTYSRWENSINSPTEKVWQQLAKYFQVSVPYLKGEIDTEYLEKLVELLILLTFPKIVISYGDTDIDDDTKPFISVEIMSQICKSLGYDSKDKFLEIYKKVIKLVDDTETVEYLQEFQSVIIQLLPMAKGITKNLLNAYDNL